MVALMFPAAPSGPRSRAGLTSPSPRLRVIEGGRSAAALSRRRVYRRRRALALVFASCTLAVLVVASAAVTSEVRSALAGTGLPAGSTQGAASAGGAAPPGEYVVRQGDSLWSIAGRVAPDDDPREVVHELAARVPGGVLQPGMRLSLDGIQP